MKISKNVRKNKRVGASRWRCQGFVIEMGGPELNEAQIQYIRNYTILKGHQSETDQTFSSSSLRATSFKSLVQRVRLSRRSCMMVAESRYSSSSRVSRSAIALSKAFLANLHAMSGLFKIS